MVEDNGKQNPGISSRDLSQALAICRKFSVTNPTIQEWRTAAWLDVVEVFGEEKSKAIFEKFRELEAAFFATNPRHSVGATVMHDAKTVRKDFLAAFPTTPNELVQMFEREFLRRNR